MKDMSDCGFCIEADFDGPNDFSSVAIVRARKDHRCCECHQVIAKGSQYHRFSGKFDGDMFTETTCLPCSEIREAFSCGGWVAGALWEEMNDRGFERLTTGCLSKLTTAAAKQFLLDKWNAWKFRERV